MPIFSSPFLLKLNNVFIGNYNCYNYTGNYFVNNIGKDNVLHLIDLAIWPIVCQKKNNEKTTDDYIENLSVLPVYSTIRSLPSKVMKIVHLLFFPQPMYYGQCELRFLRQFIFFSSQSSIFCHFCAKQQQKQQLRCTCRRTVTEKHQWFIANASDLSIDARYTTEPS